jgi:hypothetical protein
MIFHEKQPFILSYHENCKGIYLNILFIITQKVKVKESRNRPGVAHRVPGGLGFQIS